MTQIRLSLPQRTFDNVIVLNVRVNDLTLIPMLLDTGAKYTVVSSAVARRLKIETEAQQQRVAVVTANQTMRLPLVKLGRVDVHGVALTDVETVITDLPVALGVEGLLGMSFLRRCRLVLDGPEHWIEISIP